MKDAEFGGPKLNFVNESKIYDMSSFVPWPDSSQTRN